MGALNLAQALETAAQIRADGEGAVIAAVTATRENVAIPAGARMVIPARREPVGSLHPRLDPAVIAEARGALESQRSGVRSFRLTESGSELVGMEGGDMDIYLEVLALPPHLIIVGAGHIAVPLARVAALVEFDVT